MSVHDRGRGGKSSRLGLYLPFGLLVVAIVAWSAFWLWARAEVAARLDAAVADLGRAGYQIAWERREIGGYPFRLDVTLTGARVREPSGWAIATPKLEAEAYLYAATHWMFAAPAGLTFVRPEAGPVMVSGRVLRASLTDLDRRPPSFSFQGLDLVFRPAPGAQPFALQSAAKLEFHLRAGPDDQGGVFVTIDGGKARLGGLLGRIAGDRPIQLAWNATLSKMSAFTGDDWADAVRAWSEAGGQMTVRPDSRLVAGQALVAARSGTLSVGRDGRLRGVIDVALRQAPQALGAMAQTGVLPYNTADAASAVAAARQDGDTARATIDFQAGQTTLGPVALGPAPKVYTPH